MDGDKETSGERILSEFTEDNYTKDLIYTMDISVVVPLFNEEESLPELFAWIDRVMKSKGFT